MSEPEIFTPEFSLIIDGQPGSEGPVFDISGSLIYMVAPEVEVDGKPAGQVLKVDPVLKEATVMCNPSVDGYGGIPAGCQVDRDGDLWVADMRLGLLHIKPTKGSCAQVCRRDYGFSTMQGCNDCIFDCYGHLWITAPAGEIAPSPYTRSMTEPFGSVYCYSAEGLMKKIDTGYLFPNGIAVQYSKSKKPESILVAETGSKKIWSLPITDSQQGKVDLSRKSMFGRCPGHHEGGPDGMDFDAEGNLLVANWGSGFIEVFNRFGGRPHTRIKLPFKRVSNLQFKPGTSEVYVTEHDTHGLWKFVWKYEGALQYCDQSDEDNKRLTEK